MMKYTPFILNALLLTSPVIASPLKGDSNANQNYIEPIPEALLFGRDGPLIGSVEYTMLNQDSDNPAPLANKTPTTLTAPKTTEQTWLSHPAVPANNSLQNDVHFNTSDMWAKNLSPTTPTSDDIEIGFLRMPQYDAKSITARFGARITGNKVKYAISFNGGKLVYFDLPIYADADQKERDRIKLPFNKSGVIFSDEGRSYIARRVKTQIVDSAINKGNIIEANHITMRNNQIILDVKAEMINNRPAAEYHLNLAIESLKNNTSDEQQR